MKISFFTIILLVSVCFACAAERPLLFPQNQKGFIKIVAADHKKFVVTDNAVWLIEKNKLTQKSSFNFICNGATEYRDEIAMATDNGIKIFNAKDNNITDYLPKQIAGKINNIEADQQDHLWFTKEYEGCFAILDSNAILQKLKVPVTYCIARTNDSCIWAGTNIGLYKIPINGGKILRFAEEGIASYDLPDNLVERLYADSKSNVWAVMPEHISFISSADLNSEFPDYEYLGKKENELYSVTEVAQLHQAYLFLTSTGIIYINGLKAGELMRVGEIHQKIHETAFLLTDELIEKPSQFKNEKVVMIKTIGNETYFITQKGLWSVSTSKFTRDLKKKFG